MTTLYAPHEPTDEHLAYVIKQMKRRGSPVLHAHWRKGAWYALEGSHRTAAAHQLGLTPVVSPVLLTSCINHDTYNVQSKRVADVLKFYDDKEWWAVYEFPNLLPGVNTVTTKTNQLAVAARLGGMSDALESAVRALDIARRGADLLPGGSRELLNTVAEEVAALTQRVDMLRFDATKPPRRAVKPKKKKLTTRTGPKGQWNGMCGFGHGLDYEDQPCDICEHEVGYHVARPHKNCRTCAADSERVKNQFSSARKRCGRCNQLLRVEANGELEAHLTPPSPRGEPEKPCTEQRGVSVKLKKRRAPRKPRSNPATALGHE